MRPNQEITPFVESVEGEGYNEHEQTVTKVQAVEEEKPFDEGYGIGDEEPEGTNSYDVPDEWN